MSADEEHVTMSFVMDEVSVSGPCPSGAPHDHDYTYLPTAVALCLCGWVYAESFHPGWFVDQTTMARKARGQAEEHEESVAQERGQS